MALKIRCFDHVAVNLPQEEVENAKAFYGELLGLQLVAPPALKEKDVFEFIWFKIGDAYLHLRFILPPLSQPQHTGIELSDEDKAHYALQVEDVHALRKELISKGIEVFDTPTLADRDRFRIKDPYGNAIELLELHVHQRKRGE